MDILRGRSIEFNSNGDKSLILCPLGLVIKNGSDTLYVGLSLWEQAHFAVCVKDVIKYKEKRYHGFLEVNINSEGICISVENKVSNFVNTFDYLLAHSDIEMFCNFLQGINNA